MRGGSVKLHSWSKSGAGLTIGCWNCHGSAPYVRSEHWLWPYEIDKLGNICEGHAATGKADSRLTCESDGGKGCGGIGLLWHKSIFIYLYLLLWDDPVTEEISSST